MVNTNKNTETIKKQTEDYPTSQRRCVINGKRFIVTRHFVGDKDLGSLLMELAVNRANKEMGI